MTVARSVVFSPVGGEGVVEMAVRRLGDAIAVGLIGIGEQLPTELELAEQLGIATASVREALAVLGECGYVETRRGRGGGTFVCRPLLPVPPSASPSRAEQRLGNRSVAELRDLCVFHLAVSGPSASLAAERRSEDEARELASLADEMDELAGDAAFSRADSRFHIAIAGAAQSPRLVALETSIQAELQDLLASGPEPSEGHALAVAEHREIALAIRARDPHMARAVSERHLRRIATLLERRRQASSNEDAPHPPD
jgi:DNA-binding FadR family transcriptional regulator